ncbi:MAG: hypothetical protein FWB85_03050 [Chitinispirillia bacterium]|nr:hypothetical protein [Chitinispirillia bacterium]MCL2241382.1 hypothetical protein [Chitinispirillia bacterium]
MKNVPKAVAPSASTEIRTKLPSTNITAGMISAILALAAIIPAHANPADTAANPKLRVEREFRTLETNLNRYVQNDVLRANDLEQMNRMLHLFMVQNPAVTRILRVNAGGHSVNDVSAGSQHSAPSRNISAQKWYQHVSQTQKPYYSMDASAEGGTISLFYAWPLFTGPQKNILSGAVTALIDFTAHTALIEDLPPFQIAHNGKPFYQHEWDEFDHIEEPLSVRGTSGMTIRTMKPILTRLDPIAQKTTPPIENAEGDSTEDHAAEENAAESPAPAAENSIIPKAIKDYFGDNLKLIGMIMAVTLILAALLLVCSLIMSHIDKKKKMAALMDEPAQPITPSGRFVSANFTDASPPLPPSPPMHQEEEFAEEDTIDTVPEEPEVPEGAVETVRPVRPLMSMARSMAMSASTQIPEPGPEPEPPTLEPMPQPAPVPEPLPAPMSMEEQMRLQAEIKAEQVAEAEAAAAAGADNARWSGRRDTDKEQQTIIANMLKLIREDFIIMDKKIQILSQRITEIEDFIARQ